jgi:DNA helicase-2/ATP-dependent DNA helicase PcrA
VWPLDPLGPYPDDRTPGRRGAVEAGAALVRAAADTLPIGLGERAELWRIDVDRLLAERARLAGGSTVEVELPRHLSVSQLVELERDPGELARSIRRPLPRQSAPWARRGTAFHIWLEERWQAQTLLDLDQLPGAADETADDGDFESLRAAFLASEWANRTPTEVEVPSRWLCRTIASCGDGWTPYSATPSTAGSWPTGKPGASLPAPKRKPPPSSWRHTGWRGRGCAGPWLAPCVHSTPRFAVGFDWLL